MIGCYIWHVDLVRTKSIIAWRVVLAQGYCLTSASLVGLIMRAAKLGPFALTCACLIVYTEKCLELGGLGLLRVRSAPVQEALSDATYLRPSQDRGVR
jgi:hypothetical protein